MNTTDTQSNSTVEVEAHLNPHLYKVQSELLKTIDSFVKDGRSSGPVEAINTLLYHWLTTAPGKFSSEETKTILGHILSVVNFMVKLSDQQKQVEEVRTLTARLQNRTQSES